MSTIPPGDIAVAKAYKSGQLAVSDSVVGLADAAGVETEDLLAAHEVWITVGGGALRFRAGGQDPTTSAGLVYSEAAGILTVRGGANVRALRLVRDGDTDVTVDFELAKVVR
jgi:hypothetical protein